MTDLLAVLGLALMVLLYREPPNLAGRPGVAFNLSRRDVLFSLSTGFAWACFNASLVTVLSIGPPFARVARRPHRQGRRDRELRGAG